MGWEVVGGLGAAGEIVAMGGSLAMAGVGGWVGGGAAGWGGGGCEIKEGLGEAW